MSALVALLLAAPAPSTSDIVLERPQVRASIGRTPNTAAYVTIRNKAARPDRLLSASCACAARVEIHAHETRAGVARMVPVRSINVPAQGRAVLAPGGAHLMLLGLKQPLREAGWTPMTLVFERAGPVTARFRAARRIEVAAPAHAH